MDKRRDKPNQAQAMHVIGDVEGKTAIIVDDIIDTAGTLCAGADVLLKYGAKKIIACASHGVLSGPAIDRINATEALDRVIVTDTIRWVKSWHSVPSCRWCLWLPCWARPSTTSTRVPPSAFSLYNAGFSRLHNKKTSRTFMRH